MLLEKASSLEDSIVALLGEKPGCRADYIQNLVAKTHRRYTIQAVYKALRSLERSGTVVKISGKYSLSMTWIVELLGLADKIKGAYLGDTAVPLASPKAFRTKTWHFSSLGTLDRFWAHMDLELFRMSPGEPSFHWITNPWYELIPTEWGERYDRAIRLARRKIYVILAGRSPLDQALARKWPKDIYKYTCSSSPFDSEGPLFSLSTTGSYIFSVKLDREIVSQIRSFFKTTKSLNDIDPTKVLKLFNSKALASVRLEKSQAKAKALQKKFRRYFDFKEK